MENLFYRFTCCIFLCFFLISTHSKEPIQIGIFPLMPPFIMAINGKSQYVGFDINLIDEICLRLERQCQLIPLNFSGLFAAINSNAIDLGIGNLTITKERMKSHLFSLPYLPSNAQYASMEEKPYQSIPELRQKKIGVNQTQVFAELIKKEFGKNISIIPFQSTPDMVESLSQNKIDAMVLDAAVAQTLVANDKTIKLIGHEIPYGLGYGIIASPENKGLLTQVNQALLLMEADGTYRRIYNTYFGEN